MNSNHDGDAQALEKQRRADAPSSNHTPQSRGEQHQALNSATYDYLDPVGNPANRSFMQRGPGTEMPPLTDQAALLQLDSAYVGNAANLKEIPPFREGLLARRRVISEVPRELSTLEKEIKDRERSIQFQRFLRDRDSRMIPEKNPLLAKMMLRQPKPLKLQKGNLLQTFGCFPGPGVRAYGQKMAFELE